MIFSIKRTPKIRLKNCAFIAMLLMFQSAFTQKFTEGVIEYSVLNVETSDGTPLTTFTKEFIRQMLERQTAMTVTFNDHALCIDYHDYVDIDKEFYDLVKMEKYIFRKRDGQDVFYKEVLSPTEIYLTKDSNFKKMQFDNGTPISEKVFGLQCTRYNKISEGEDEVSVVLTKDLQLKENLQFINLTKIKGMLVSVETNSLLRNTRIKFGIKSFTPIVVDQSALILDTIGKQNMSKPFGEMLEDMLEEMRKKNNENILKEYGKYKPQKVNQDLIKSLIQEGALDENSYYVEEAVKSDVSYDIPSILLLPALSATGLPTMSTREVKDILTKHKMLSPSLVQLLNDETGKPEELPFLLKYKAICLAAVKDHLANGHTRLQIIENMQVKTKIDLSQNETAHRYASGELSLYELYAMIPLVSELRFGMAKSDEEILAFADHFFKSTIDDPAVPITLELKDQNIQIKTPNYIYSLDLDLLKTINYENAVKEDPALDLVFEDHTLIDEVFYSKLIKTANQIGADNSTGKIYHVFALRPPYVNEISKEEYDLITERLPYLKMDGGGIFTLRTAKKDINRDKYSFGTSFLYHPKAKNKEITLHSIFGGMHYSQKDFLLSSQKDQYKNFLEKHASNFDISPDELANLHSEITMGLYDSPDALLESLSGSCITVNSKIYFGVNPAYQITVGPAKNTFKDLYPNIYALVGDDFSPTDFAMNEENKKITFSYQSERHSIGRTDDHLLSFLISLETPFPSGKKIYPMKFFAPYKEVYIYLTPDHKKELAYIFPELFDRKY